MPVEVNCCRICGEEKESAILYVPERRQKTGEKFPYFCCPSCGCLQIARIPKDMEPFYRDYYSIKESEKRRFYFVAKLRKYLFSYLLYRKSLSGFIVHLFQKNAFNWLRKGEMTFDSSILDVGCGNGRLLTKMADSGFTHLRGIDPFIKHHLTHHCRTSTVEINKCDIRFAFLSEKISFDVIMLHHVLEHMEDQHAVFEQFRRLLRPKGTLLIELPIINSFAWEKYGILCFQLEDAPRHFFLHTPQSLAFLANQHGFQIDEIRYLSSPIIFTASEQPKSGKNFSRKELHLFSRQAKELAIKKQSGLACFYLSLKS